LNVTAAASRYGASPPWPPPRRASTLTLVAGITLPPRRRTASTACCAEQHTTPDVQSDFPNPTFAAAAAGANPCARCPRALDVATSTCGKRLVSGSRHAACRRPRSGRPTTRPCARRHLPAESARRHATTPTDAASLLHGLPMGRALTGASAARSRPARAFLCARLALPDPDRRGYRGPRQPLYRVEEVPNDGSATARDLHMVARQTAAVTPHPSSNAAPLHVRQHRSRRCAWDSRTSGV